MSKSPSQLFLYAKTFHVRKNQQPCHIENIIRICEKLLTLALLLDASMTAELAWDAQRPDEFFLSRAKTHKRHWGERLSVARAPPTLVETLASPALTSSLRSESRPEFCWT